MFAFEFLHICLPLNFYIYVGLWDSAHMFAFEFLHICFPLNFYIYVGLWVSDICLPLNFFKHVGLWVSAYTFAFEFLHICRSLNFYIYVGLWISSFMSALDFFIYVGFGFLHTCHSLAPDLFKSITFPPVLDMTSWLELCAMHLAYPRDAPSEKTHSAIRCVTVHFAHDVCHCSAP